MGKHNVEIFWKLKKDTALLKFTLFLEKEKSALVFEAVPVSSGELKWENEIAVGLNLQEIGVLIQNVRRGAGTIKFQRELERTGIKGERVSPQGTKTFSFEKKNDSAAVRLGVEMGGREIRNAAVNLDAADLVLFEMLLNKSAERILGF